MRMRAIRLIIGRVQSFNQSRRTQDFRSPMAKSLSMSNLPLTRRQLAQQALAAVLLLPALASPTRAQVVDPGPDVPPPLPTAPVTPAAAAAINEGPLLTQLVPINAGYVLTQTQAKEVALQLKDYPGAFAKARAYVLPDEIGPAFAADAPTRKGRVR